ncbi:hypothetical protein ACWCQK_32820 [Streptomyces sp. NPDC002306]
MSTSTRHHTQLPRSGRPEQVAGLLLALGGVAFFAGGALHPADSGRGSKVDQLHDMMVDSMWYPSHALLLTATVCFAAAILAFRRRDGLGSRMTAVTGAFSVIAVVTTIGMALHLFAALGADGIAGGEKTVIYHVQTWNETIIDPLWGVGIAALAVAGGLTRTVGNPTTLALGVVGGLAYSLASATIAFTDRFDTLFPLASLIGIWAVVAGLMMSLRKARSRGASPAPELDGTETSS